MDIIGEKIIADIAKNCVYYYSWIRNSWSSYSCFMLLSFNKLEIEINLSNDENEEHDEWTNYRQCKWCSIILKTFFGD